MATSSSIAEVTIGPGFDVETLSIYSAFGTANINAFNLTAGRVQVASSGYAASLKSPRISGLPLSLHVSSSSIAKIGLETLRTVSHTLQENISAFLQRH